MNKIKDYLYIFQLEGYDRERFLDWLKINKETKIIYEKNKIQWTNKAKIIYGLSLVINFLSFGINPAKSIIFSSLFFALPEIVVKNYIVLLAKNKIKKYPNLIVIGITGSYGKTSVKEILAHFLSVKYKVLKTPESFNTPLGVGRVVLKKLKKEDEIFICEMGAYKKNDIKMLCDIVKPKFGILTAIGKQHLERFKNEANILKTKFELVSSLPRGGVAFLNGNNPKIIAESKKYSNCEINFFGIKNENIGNISENFYLTASNIKITKEGTFFDLYPTDKKNGGEVRVFTPLLGEHNVLNVCGAASIAYYLGIKLPEIVKIASTLPPISHRLQLIPGANNTTVIDDAFNANPDSFKEALKVLSEFPSDCKIIITPGVVELGSLQYEENLELGEEAVKIFDYIIIVGKTNRQSLMEGIDCAKNDGKNVKSIFVDNLKEAMEKLTEIVVPGAVILFENDLPDQYN